MKVLIISDTHGKTSSIKQVHDIVGDDIDMLIHLGDVCGDEAYIRDTFKCELHMVAGNNDFYCDLPNNDVFMIGRYKAFITHGHRYNVHYSTEKFRNLIKEQGYDFVMYGHTHRRDITRYGGSYIINPGSLALPRDNRTGTYLLLEFDKNGKPFFAENELPGSRPSGEKKSLWDLLY